MEIAPLVFGGRWKSHRWWVGGWTDGSDRFQRINVLFFKGFQRIDVTSSVAG